MAWIAAFFGYVRSAVIEWGRRRWYWLAIGGSLATSFFFGRRTTPKVLDSKIKTETETDTDRRRVADGQDVDSRKEEVVVAASAQGVGEVTAEVASVRGADEDTLRINRCVQDTGDEMRK